MRIKELVDFVLDFRGKNSFIKYSTFDIINDITNAIKTDSLFIDIKNNKIVCMFIAIQYPEDKVLYIKQLISIDKDSFKSFIDLFKVKWKGWTLVAKRKGKQVTYKNIDRMFNLLMKKGSN